MPCISRTIFCNKSTAAAKKQSKRCVQSTIEKPNIYKRNIYVLYDTLNAP